MYPYDNGFLLYGVPLLTGIFILLRTKKKDSFNRFLGFIILKPILPFIGLVVIAYIRTFFFSNLVIGIKTIATVFAFFEIVTAITLLYYCRELFLKSKMSWLFQ